MTRFLLCFFWVTIVCDASGKDTPKAVAFSCGRPSLFLTEDGWIQDPNQRCLDIEMNIVEYCQKIYPDGGIVRATVSPIIQVNLEGWCPLSLSAGCSKLRRENHSIQPWICSAQTQRILLTRIPPFCHFLKLETTATSVCRKESYWSDLANVRCQKIHKLQYTKPCIKPEAYAHLHFLGADLVCCEPGTSNESASRDLGLLYTQNSSVVSDAPAYHRYLGIRPDEVDKISERNQFISAKAALNESVRKKRKLLERRLIEAESHLSDGEWLTTPELTQASESAAHKEFRQHFVKLMEEAQTLAHHLDAVHQQRVLQLMKTHESETALLWSTVLSRNPPNLTQILNAAEHLVTVIQRNQHHLIKRYEHLRSVNPLATKIALEGLKVNLAHLNRTLENSLEKLELLQAPTFKVVVLKFVTDMLNTRYNELNAFARSVASLKEDIHFLPSQKEYVLQAERIIEKHRRHLPSLDPEKPVRVAKKVAEIGDSGDELADGHATPLRPITLTVLANVDGKWSSVSSLVSEKIGNSSVSAEPRKINTNSTRDMSQPVTGSATSTHILAVVLSLPLCFGLVIFTVYACHFRLRRMRLRRAGYSQTVVEVPEIYDDHSLRSHSTVGLATDDAELLSHWQLNGYENPAYKFPKNIIRFQRPL